MTSKLWTQGGLVLFHAGVEPFRFYELVSRSDGRIGFRLEGEGLSVRVPCVFGTWRTAYRAAFVIADEFVRGRSVLSPIRMSDDEDQS